MAKKKVERAREEDTERLMKECSFAPQTLRATQRRNLKGFLQAQQDHITKKQHNINRLVQDNKQREEEEVVGHPAINLKSRVLAATKQGPSNPIPVHERLFAISKKQLCAVDLVLSHPRSIES